MEAERRSPTSRISGERFDRISIPAQAQIRELMSRLPRLLGSVILVALYLLGPLVSPQSANANDVSVAQGQKDLGSVLEIHGNVTVPFYMCIDIRKRRHGRWALQRTGARCIDFSRRAFWPWQAIRSSLDKRYWASARTFNSGHMG